MLFTKILLLSLLIVGCSKDNLTVEQKQGRARYRQHCTQCHNLDSKKNNLGPALHGVKKELLIDRLTNGYKAMPAMPDKLIYVDKMCLYLECS
jgi:cytochrome c2